MNIPLHLYLGATVQRQDGELFFIEAVYRDGSASLRSPIYGQISYDPNFQKLCLRRISDMKEEEAVNLYTLEIDGMLHRPTNDFDVRRSGNGWRICRLDFINRFLFINDYGNIWKVTDDDNADAIIDVVMHQSKLFQYLLSLHFWLGEDSAFGKIIIDKESLK